MNKPEELSHQRFTEWQNEVIARRRMLKLAVMDEKRRETAIPPHTKQGGVSRPWRQPQRETINYLISEERDKYTVRTPLGRAPETPKEAFIDSKRAGIIADIIEKLEPTQTGRADIEPFVKAALHALKPELDALGAKQAPITDIQAFVRADDSRQG